MEFSVREAVTQLGVSRQAIHKKIKQLGLKPKRCGNRYLLSQEQLNKIIAISSNKSTTFSSAEKQDSSNSSKLPLLSRKYTVPSLPAETLYRPRLLKQLDKIRNYRLALVTGPAGSGKTTLLCQWVRQSNKKIAWITLDWVENEEEYFFAYLIMALDELYPAVNFSKLLEKPFRPNLKNPSLVCEAVTKLEQIPSRTTIVIDNFHVIRDERLLSTFLFFVKHLPPSVHVVVADRRILPPGLSHFKISDQVLEVNSDQLRFNRDEIKQYVEHFTELGTDNKRLHSLETRTDGWITGLRIDCQVRQQIDDSNTLLNNFTGDYGIISKYLHEVAFDNQTGEEKRFLLETSILQTLDVALCDAVTSRSDSREMIQKLIDKNVFLLAVDKAQTVYRYNSMYARWLRHQLAMTKPGKIHELHNRASHWYLSRKNYINGIYHALESKDYDLATRIIEKEYIPMLLRDDVSTIKKWLEALPLDFLKSSRQLRIACTWVLHHKQRYEQVTSEFNALQTEINELGSRSLSDENKKLQGELAMFGAILAYSQGQYSQAIRRCNDILESLDEFKLPFRSEIRFILGDSYFLNGNLEQSSDIWQSFKQARVENISQRIHDLISYRTFQLLFLKGELKQIEKMVKKSKQLKDGSWKDDGIASIVQGQLFYERNQLKEAGASLKQAIESTSQNRPWLALHAYISMARLQNALGDWSGAKYSLGQARIKAEMTPDLVFTRIVQVWQANLALLQGNGEGETGGIKTGFQEEAHIDYVGEIECLTSARFYLYQNEIRKALTLLNRLHSINVTKGKKGRMIEILALKALAYQKSEDMEKAFDNLESSVTMAKEQGYCRIYLDEGSTMRDLLLELAGRRKSIGSGLNGFLEQLISGYRDSNNVQLQSGGSQVLHEHNNLTPRELQVLRMMAKGLSNQEIAKHLYIATCTVKKHVNRIFDKLSVERRTKAVYKAKKYKLL